MPAVTMRAAGPGDLAILRRWDSYAHIQDSGGPDDDWAWESELGREPWPDWRWWFMGEVSEPDGEARPVGFLAIIDPAREESQYWGAECPPDLRAIDIWLGEVADQRKGFGRAMMEHAIAHCFGDPGVRAIVIDPLASNTPAHAFYRAMGFTPIGPRRFGVDDCLIFELKRADWRSNTS